MKIKQIMAATPGTVARFYDKEADALGEMSVQVFALVWERGHGTGVVPMVLFADGTFGDPSESENFVEVVVPGQTPMTLEEAKAHLNPVWSLTEKGRRLAREEREARERAGQA